MTVVGRKILVIVIGGLHSWNKQIGSFSTVSSPIRDSRLCVGCNVVINADYGVVTLVMTFHQLFIHLSMTDKCESR